ncbi:hypothetical protein [Streptomyces atratus]|uniref:hypothetical protein n=1 Tax=Streptomyces atratus TaxID=1893 RepID=UPI00225A22FA|nr:hypothetical protein [Streptomyces atratus]MCX5345820.1 hypothetical protein [Streptomyces atratus]
MTQSPVEASPGDAEPVERLQCAAILDTDPDVDLPVVDDPHRRRERYPDPVGR